MKEHHGHHQTDEGQPYWMLLYMWHSTICVSMTMMAYIIHQNKIIYIHQQLASLKCKKECNENMQINMYTSASTEQTSQKEKGNHTMTETFA